MEPLTPQSLCDGPSPDLLKLAKLDIKRLRGTLQSERITASKIERLLVKQNDQLEQQIADLRGLYLATIAPKPTAASTEKK